MCEAMIKTKRQEKEILKSLKVNRLFSVDILVESIEVTHGPYKNSGDLDNITQSEDSEDEDADHMDDLNAGDAGIGEGMSGENVTVGLALTDQDCRNRSKSPRFKKTCHTIAIDSWAPGVVSSAAYVPPQDTRPRLEADTPLQLCKSCLNDCLMNKSRKSDKCTCEKEYCFSYPIDSLGPKINSSSGLPKKKCICPEHKTQRRARSREKPKKKESEDEEEGGHNKDSKGKGDSSKVKKDKKGKDSAGKGKEVKGKAKPKKEIKTDDEEEHVEEEEPPKPKPKKRKCERPPKPDGPLPPLRVSISLFHIKDVKINQVDLDKLYPVDDEDIPGDDSEPEIQVFEGPKVSLENQVSVKRDKGIKKKKKDKRKDSNKSSSKSSGKSSASSKQGKSSKASDTSKQSKNVVKMKKGHQGVDVRELSAALSSLPKSDVSQLSVQDHHLSGLSKYRELGGWDTAKCSGDLALKQKTARKLQRSERERRKGVIESLRGVTEFKRGLSFVFTSTPLDIISRLLVEKLEIVVDRCAINGPSYPIGKAKIKLPHIFRDRVQAGAREKNIRPLWTCQEDTYPIIDCKGQDVGNITLYFCLTSLGRALVSTSLVSESSLYEYAGSAYYVSNISNSEPKPRATGFNMCYGNLQHINLKHYDPPKNPGLQF